MVESLKEMTRHFLPYFSSSSIAKLDKEKSIILLPVASIEQHGPHLPVFTDSLIAQAVIERSLKLLPEGFPVYYLPLLSYGRSSEHIGFPGTISLSSETLLRVLEEIAGSVQLSGFKRLAILNAHGGNSELIDVAIRDIRMKHDLLVFGLHVYLRIGIPTEGLSTTEKTYGIHAGDIETSILLHSCPELVNMSAAPDGTPMDLIHGNTAPFSDPLNFAWLTKDISSSGVLGNAQTADPKRGEKYLDDAANEIASLLYRIRDFNF